jgi:hypothetical protein
VQPSLACRLQPSPALNQLHVRWQQALRLRQPLLLLWLLLQH